ncbi:cell wall-binding repeat-containing protein [Paenibacillus sambharensis]|uniref:Cell wall-binding repeat-containing protein n=1 Tax=Paenibacillus sambharensis TaxID=1803190 RepID=A0A2W1LL21_9BACL|nr:cell wall-binding repeat-containing protein [Paenibacillus sambharensis]PZD95595.1 cell wall-binding repeat-containing protein [Paenibacillus sambharensis]
MKQRIKLAASAAVIAVFLAGCTGNGNAGTGEINQGAGNSGNAGQAAANSGEAAPWIASKNTTRVNTDDPAEAAVLVSRMLWMATDDSNRPGGIIVVNPADWQTALASVNLVHHPFNGPVLFTDGEGSLPDVTQKEMERLKPAGIAEGVQVLLVGQLSEEVSSQIEALGYRADRIEGGSPAETGRQIDAYYAKLTGSVPQSVVVGSMEQATYTLPAANWIAHMPEPLLYVTKDSVPQETAQALQTRGGQANIYLLGPEAVVSSEVEQKLQEYGRVVRIAGEDPHRNAIAFARYADPATGFGWGITQPGANFSFLSAGSDPALAIAAAPFSHLGKHSPLLLVDKSAVPDAVSEYLAELQPKFDKTPTEGPYNHGWLTGSEAQLTAGVQGQLDTRLEIVSSTGAGHESHGGSGHNGTDADKSPDTAAEEEAQPDNSHSGHH